MYEIYFIYYRREDGFIQKIKVRKYDTFDKAFYHLKIDICNTNENKFSAYLFNLVEYQRIQENIPGLYFLNIQVNHSMFNGLKNYYLKFSDDERLEIISKQQKYWKEVY